MTPAAIYKAVRDLLVISAIAFVAYRIFADGKNSVRAEQLDTLQKQVNEQGKMLAHWHQEATDANAQLTASLGRINSAPVVVHDWVQPQPNCPGLKVLSAASSSALNSATDRGPILAVPGEPAGDSRLRDTAVADFKRFWESQLADYRAEHAQWPQP